MGDWEQVGDGAARKPGDFSAVPGRGSPSRRGTGPGEGHRLPTRREARYPVGRPTAPAILEPAVCHGPRSDPEPAGELDHEGTRLRIRIPRLLTGRAGSRGRCPAGFPGGTGESWRGGAAAVSYRRAAAKERRGESGSRRRGAGSRYRPGGESSRAKDHDPDPARGPLSARLATAPEPGEPVAVRGQNRDRRVNSTMRLRDSGSEYPGQPACRAGSRGRCPAGFPGGTGESWRGGAAAVSYRRAAAKERRGESGSRRRGAGSRYRPGGESSRAKDHDPDPARGPLSARLATAPEPGEPVAVRGQNRDRRVNSTMRLRDSGSGDPGAGAARCESYATNRSLSGWYSRRIGRIAARRSDGDVVPRTAAKERRGESESRRRGAGSRYRPGGESSRVGDHDRDPARGPLSVRLATAPGTGDRHAFPGRDRTVRVEYEDARVKVTVR